MHCSRDASTEESWGLTLISLFEPLLTQEGFPMHLLPMGHSSVITPSQSQVMSAISLGVSPPSQIDA